ncbi:MAG: peptidylprolyl isomerase [Flavobacteriaceae bacterium]
MAILSKIREKTVFLIFIIALGLFAFLIDPTKLIDFFANGGTKEYLAKVDDEVIYNEAFARQVEAAQRGNQQSTIQVANRVYDQEVTRILLNNELDKLGITVEKDQMWDLFKTNYANVPDFKNESGEFDEGKLKEFIESQVEANPIAWEQQEKSIAFSGKQQLYYALVKAGSLPTEKEGEVAYKMQNDLVDMKYVYLPYTEIADSTITISKEKIQAYVNAHKNQFEEEANAAVQYVYFEEKPSEEDENEFNTKINALLPELKNTTNIADFINENSAIKHDTIYKLKTALEAPIQALVDSMQIGDTYGPYTANGFSKIMKLTGKKLAPSVKASHALIAYEGAQRANPDVKRTKEEAKALAEELLTEAKASGTDFAAFATEHSDGPSASKGGDLGWFYENQMVPAFNDYVFNNSKESIGLVETDFGFHIIKIVDTKEENKYQIATLAMKVEASQKTIDALYADASQFEVDVNEGDFIKVSETKNYAVRPVSTITNLSENLPGLQGSQRQIVKWLFNDDTKIGDIKRFDINGNYAVVQITSRKEKGVMSADDASFKVLPILRNKEKAEQLKAKMSANTLADNAANNNTTVRTANAISMANPTLPGAGREPKVVGTAFALENGQVSSLIEGEKGVYMIEVTKQTLAPKMDSYKTFAKDPNNNINAVGAKVIDALKKKAVIEDNRAVFY